MKENEYKDLKYILTSTMRTKLIISIYEKSKNLDDLRNELGKPSATILHGLKELENANYVKKLNKYYSLTSNGYLLAVNLIKLIENWYSVDVNKVFWNNHSLDYLPEEAMKNLYRLKNAECITSTNKDLSQALGEYIKLISDCEELKIILPIFSEIHLDKIIEISRNGKARNIEIITTNKIADSIKSNPIYSNALKENKHIGISILNKKTNIYLTVSEKFVSLNLFFKDGHFDDSQLLVDKTKEGINWGNELFKHYKYTISEP
ncbi:MAG: DUF1724 domain-containing protein [Methanobrevibacter sp.]|uniref:helix-turn-helix transcriptional regulator n=1 Tax=Methanobrevibacter sp. TaxID=66852 RepID=UPI0026DFBB39|nr:transcriptional regulator FilR1 domain-containing protein [Methanobrevibacter sp.]MDO5848859.1 DUF1724 domain-containing protein [Methanobrevibacter sp.]